MSKKDSAEFAQKMFEREREKNAKMMKAIIEMQQAVDGIVIAVAKTYGIDIEDGWKLIIPAPKVSENEMYKIGAEVVGDKREITVTLKKDIVVSEK